MVLGRTHSGNLKKNLAEKSPVLREKHCVLPPETGVFRRFSTVFDGLFSDPGRPGATGARRRAAADIDLSVSKIILLKQKG
ncbi:MAG: hypothetical protein O3C34_08785, partial [Proteobacteria bacterium]|nr:hypothetical protein [Pseudomonadota bacterium]